MAVGVILDEFDKRRDRLRLRWRPEQDPQGIDPIELFNRLIGENRKAVMRRIALAQHVQRGPGFRAVLSLRRDQLFEWCGRTRVTQFPQGRDTIRIIEVAQRTGTASFARSVNTGLIRRSKVSWPFSAEDRFSSALSNSISGGIARGSSNSASASA